jgi:protein SCO1
MRTLALVLVAVLAVSGCSGPADGPRAAASRPPVAPPDPVALIREKHLPNVELVTHEGRVVHFYDDLVKGHAVAINFMFSTCRNACPDATRHLLAVQQALGDSVGREVSLLSISLDPERDTPEVLRGYVEAHGIGPGWTFLTGRLQDIELLRRSLGAYELDPALDADRTQHAGIVILGNEPRGRWRAIPALSNPVRIRQAIERVLLPPSQWPTGAKAIDEVPFEESAASRARVEPADLTAVSVSLD